jgi:hypothetical protein
MRSYYIVSNMYKLNICLTASSRNMEIRIGAVRRANGAAGASFGEEIHLVAR